MNDPFNEEPSQGRLDTLDSVPGLSPKPRRSRRSLLVAVTATLAAGAGGYYAWQFHDDREAARAELAAVKDERKALADALELHRSSKINLDTQLTECKSTKAVAVTELSVCQASVTDLAEHKEKTEALLGEFNSLTSRFQRMIDSGQLDVAFRRGQMVVKLPARVLFPSGSATLSDKGKQALAEVAKVLRSMKQRRFLVAGHTDNVPISGEFANNWELSTARAVRVTTMLIEHGVRPQTVAAAGYGQYMPVASNKSKAGRRRNRRIEIILEPDLRKLPLHKLVQKKKKQRRAKRK